MSSSRYEDGKVVRAEVLGPEYVAKELEQSDDFIGPFQELVTEVVWGTIWNRPELDRKTRSLLDLAILGALGKTHGLGVHIQAALRNGCTRVEIREVLLQVAAYAGISTGAEAFRVARAVLRESRG